MIFALSTLVAPASVPEIIVVRAERLPAVAASGLSLSGAELDNASGTRLDEALRLVPGVSLFRRTPSGAANATIQGLSLRPIAPNGAGRTLVSLDGVPQNDPFGGWIYWGRYDRVFLEDIVVRRGGAGAGFGPMALTGTLDLTEARGQPASLTASFGPTQTATASARGSLKTQGAVFTAMAAFDTSDGVFGVSRTLRGAADQPLYFQSSALTLVTDIARVNGSWSFRGSGFSERKGAGLVGGQSRAEGLDVSLARRFEHEIGQSRIIVYAQGRDFANQTVSVSSGRTTTTPALDQFATPSSALGGSVAFQPSNGSTLPSLSLDWRQAEGETRERFRFIGNDFTRTRVAGGKQDLVGLSLSLPRPVTFAAGNISLIGVVRADHWANRAGRRLETDRATGNQTLIEGVADRSGSVVTGSVSLSQTRGPATVSFYRTFRPPTLNELHRPFRIGNDVTEANANLVPETLEGIDLDLRASSPLGHGRLTTAATFYVNRLNAPIANVTVGTGPGVFPRVGFLPAGGSLRERRNVGDIDASGLEASLRWDAPNRVLSSLYAAASWTDATVEGGTALPQLTGKRPAQAPRWSGVANATLNLDDGLTASVLIRGEGTRFEDDLNARALAAYGALDIRLAWQINPQSEIFLSGENLLDSKIATAQAADGTVSLTQQRMVRFGVRLKR